MSATIRPLQAVDADAPFSRAELSDDALTAAIWATSRFNNSFPGWQLYRRIMTGWSGYDRDLLAWAIGCARKLARAKTVTGRDYLRSDARGPWIALAAGDALCGAIYGRFPVNADARGYVRGTYANTYRKIRDPLAGCMVFGMENFRAELHYQYRQALKVQIDEKPCDTKLRGSVMRVRANIVGAVHDPGASNAMLAVIHRGDGNFVTLPESIHD